jgi:hypothetical protein
MGCPNNEINGCDRFYLIDFPKRTFGKYHHWRWFTIMIGVIANHFFFETRTTK